mmetsp:Transcript_17553/g.33287  ORF Transcript_17553/g.33287 Transcript_17553/m.33287 type:complete len:658 (+) Transcript_17553:72-2045(+)
MLDLGHYQRRNVSNLVRGYDAFQQGLRLLLAFQHELASLYFMECTKLDPECALAHAMISYCHCPNYNFKGAEYYAYSMPEIDEVANSMQQAVVTSLDSERRQELVVATAASSSSTSSETHHHQQHNTDWHHHDQHKNQLSIDKTDHAAEVMHVEEENTKYPCQLIADRHSRMAVEIVQHLTGKQNAIKDVEAKLIAAIRILTCNPGIDPEIAEEMNDVPFAETMEDVHSLYPDDAEVAYIYVSSIMTLHAWKLYEYPTGRPLSEDVLLVKDLLETSLRKHPTHLGLCHLYCHLCEMSSHPEDALVVCDVLRTYSPDAGHLVHMPTHIDVQVGDYEACVKWNAAAIKADKKLMQVASKMNNPLSFYFGYIVHDYHMYIYGCILGGYEKIAMDMASEINNFVNEGLFIQSPFLAAYLESYSAMEIDVMVRFGRWQEILKIQFPRNRTLMLYRTATLHFARAIAYANLGALDLAEEEARFYEDIRVIPEAKRRILHNNSVYDLLEVDSEMAQGEIAYFGGNYNEAWIHLRKAVDLQDQLSYDEPWGKMQPIRHALGGLLLKNGHVDDAEKVFREDLKQHPKNPWALSGLIRCLEKQMDSISTKGLNIMDKSQGDKMTEIYNLKMMYQHQRQSQWADFEITHACECCCHPPDPANAKDDQL